MGNCFSDILHREEGQEPEGKKSKIEMEEISDDEELIEFIPEAPPLRFKTESSADVNQQYFMRSWCRTWARRKKVLYTCNMFWNCRERMYTQKQLQSDSRQRVALSEVAYPTGHSISLTGARMKES